MPERGAVLKSDVRTIHVPAYDYEETHWLCEECDYDSTDEFECQKHVALTHSVRAEETILKEKFRFFRTEEDAKTWLSQDDFSDFTEVKWGGPGWYGNECHHSVGGCRCGRCDRYTTVLIPAAQYIERWKQPTATLEQAAAIPQIEALISRNAP